MKILAFFIHIYDAKYVTNKEEYPISYIRSGGGFMAKYGKKAQEKVGDVMHEYKRGQLKTKGGKTVKSRKQAVAIGLSEARESGAKVPKKGN